ncbi:hypothetical protein [Herbidospora mongoliensis]|nr:hypothetical protein [Herbidospora mongoliensis]
METRQDLDVEVIESPESSCCQQAVVPEPPVAGLQLVEVEDSGSACCEI